MLHAKFHIHRTYGSREENFKGFYHIWAWRPSWSCDLDHLFKLSFPLHQGAPTWNLALIGQAVPEKMFENDSHVHVYSPMTEADSTLGSKSFQKHNFF